MNMLQQVLQQYQALDWAWPESDLALGVLSAGLPSIYRSRTAPSHLHNDTNPPGRCKGQIPTENEEKIRISKTKVELECASRDEYGVFMRRTAFFVSGQQSGMFVSSKEII